MNIIVSLCQWTIIKKYDSPIGCTLILFKDSEKWDLSGSLYINNKIIILSEVFTSLNVFYLIKRFSGEKVFSDSGTGTTYLFIFREFN